MALIACPECKNMISDRANACPHCGLPAEYFYETSNRPIEIDYANIGNVLISFDTSFKTSPASDLTLQSGYQK